MTQQETQALDPLAAGFASPVERDAAIERAFDFRGDVTVRTADGRVVQGYIFDRRRAGTDSSLRIIPSDGGERVTLRYDEVAALAFTGRDTAAGKSFETWVKKYVEKKTRGESATLHPEPLDEH